MSEVRTHWFWRMMTYPIPVLSGWHGRSPKVRASAAGLIESSALPSGAKVRVREVVQRSRLWKREKTEVAAELIAHFRDGLEAGRPAEELLATFGEAKTAARLIRRSKKRNRPLWWHAQRRLFQTVGILLLIYVGLAGLLAIRHPNPRVDYVAELNRTILAAAPADRAAPIYRDAWLKAHVWELKDDALYVRDPDGKPVTRTARPGDVDWPATAAFLREHRAFFDAMREAGLKPSGGWELRRGDISPEDRLAIYGESKRQSELAAANSRVDRLMSQSMITVLLPNLAPMRQSANLLAGDMRLAASEGDSPRVLTDYRALVGMARQLGEAPVLVNELVGLGIVALADQTLMEINQAAPQQLSPCRVELLHTMAGVRTQFTMDLSGERTCLLDNIQRVYSDDGHGDGAATLDGLQWLARMQPWYATSDHKGINALQGMSLPAAGAMMASRKEITEQMERFYAMAAEDTGRPLWVKLRTPEKSEALIRGWKGSTWGTVRYALLTIYAGSFQRASLAFDRGRAAHETAMVALSLEAYRDAAGHYPDTLAALSPHYLPAAPLDYSTGGPLRYKLVDGKPLLYGLGKDGVDDGGVWTDKKIHWPDVPDTGDWVLYPPVETD